MGWHLSILKDNITYHWSAAGSQLTECYHFGEVKKLSRRKNTDKKADENQTYCDQY